jgi:hypothetical protein
MTTATKTSWQITGEYFENCNCDVVCPCEISPLGFMQARPDKGYCDVFMVFHINEGRFGDTDLKGLNFIMAVHAPEVMAKGKWAVAAYIDDKASTRQQEALGAIFTGAAGGPMSAMAPLVGQNLGVKVVPINYQNMGKKRSAVIPKILNSTIQAVPALTPDAVIVKDNVNPLFPKDWVQATGVASTYHDYSFHWDNSGKCADYAPFKWSGS